MTKSKKTVERTKASPVKLERVVIPQLAPDNDFEFSRIDVTETKHAIYYDTFFKSRKTGTTFKTHASCFKCEMSEVAV